MPPIKTVEEGNAPQEVEKIYESIKKELGVSEIPNTFRAMANKPEFLKSILKMDGAVFKDDKLDSKTKHLMAVAVSAACGCEYCLHAHVKLSKAKGASNEEVSEALTVAAVMGAYNNFNKALGLKNDIKPEW